MAAPYAGCRGYGAASAVVNGTPAISPVAPTAERTICWAKHALVTICPAARRQR